MAKTLTKNLSFSIGVIIAGTIEAVRAVKQQDIAIKESNFQSLVSEGSISYDGQLEYRKKQLADEQNSSIPDATFIATLKSSIGQITKLKRFNTYRTAYQKNLGDYKSGIETAKQHLDFLQNQYDHTTDPDLQAEIMSEITSAREEVKRSSDAVLANEVTRAQKDGTQTVLDTAIEHVNKARAQAKLIGNDEAVSSYDITLTNLTSQKSTVKIQDDMNKLEITGLTKGLNAPDKLNQLSMQVAFADGTAPVTVNGKNYTSSKEYWSTVLNGYLSGVGTGLFQNFFSELTSTYNSKINAAVARDGNASMALDQIKGDFELLRSNSSMTPYLNQLGDLENQALGAAIQTVAKSVLDTASYNQDFKAADATLQKYGQLYGVDVQQYRLALADDINKQALSAARGDIGIAKGIVAKTGVPGITTPQQEFSVSPKIDLSGRYGLVGTAVYDKTTNSWVSEDQLKAQTGMSTLDWGKIKLDTAYRPPAANAPAPAPAPSAPAPAPASQPINPPKPTNTPTPTPAPTPSQPHMLNVSDFANMPTPTPAPAPAPAPAAAPTSTRYQGSSIIDYLKGAGQDTSFTNRQKLAQANGISNYVGSAEQNLKLLGSLNK
jgi:hypothetical protein